MVSNPLTSADSVETEVNRLRLISKFLDNQFRIPFTNIRFGVDPLVGLFPVIGDVLTSVFSVYIVYKAYLLGMPYSTLFRMVFNIIMDTLLGSISTVGDVFDGLWKSNAKNVDLLEERGADPDSVNRDWWFGILFIALPIFAVVVGIVVAVALAIAAVFSIGQFAMIGIGV